MMTSCSQVQTGRRGCWSRFRKWWYLTLCTEAAIELCTNVEIIYYYHLIQPLAKLFWPWKSWLLHHVVRKRVLSTLQSCQWDSSANRFGKGFGLQKSMPSGSCLFWNEIKLTVNFGECGCRSKWCHHSLFWAAPIALERIEAALGWQWRRFLEHFGKWDCRYTLLCPLQQSLLISCW